MPYRRRFPHRCATLLACLLGAFSLSGVSVSPDIRRLDPSLVDLDRPVLLGSRGLVTGLAARDDRPLPVLLRTVSQDPSLSGTVSALGGTAREVSRRVVTATVPPDALRFLSNHPSVAYVSRARTARPLLDTSRPAVRADIVQEGGSGLPSAFTGRGVMVGIVDTGVSHGHRDFFTPSAPPQSRIAHRAPAPSLPGVDTEWHGTHVTGIAAGNGIVSGGRFRGMAPEATILAYKTSFSIDDILAGASDLLAAAGNAPVAINMSLGAATGPHDGTGSFEAALEDLATGPPGSRRIIAVAAGNANVQGDLGEHARLEVPPFGRSADVPVHLEEPVANPPSIIDLWADGADEYTVVVAFPDDYVVAASGTRATSSDGKITVSNRTDRPVNNATHIVIEPAPALAHTTGTIALVRTRNGGSGVVDAYIDALDGQFSGGALSSASTITEPGNADNVIAVGSFNTRGNTGFGPADAISSFSSRGPTRDGRIKPDLAAPGTGIASTRSLDPYLGDPFGRPDDIPDKPPPPYASSYAVMSGTSMSTPHATGVAALVWQSDPSLTGAQMRARLRATASGDASTGSVPNSAWGYGKLDALRAVSSTVAAIAAPSRAETGATVPLGSGNSSAAFGHPLVSYQWSAPGATLGSANGTETTFTAGTPGNYTVRLTVSQALPGGTPAATASTVIRVNRIPAASIAGPASATDNAQVTFSGASSADPDGQPLENRWSLVSRPVGSRATVSASGTLAPDIAGTYLVGLRVDDGLDNSALATHAFTLTGRPGAPGITTTPPTTAVVGTTLRYGIGASGSSPLTYSLVSAPAGMTISPNDGAIAWTPSPSQAGPHTVVARVGNGTFSDAIQSFVVNVYSSGAEVPPPPLTSFAAGGGGGGCSMSGYPHPGGIPTGIAGLLLWILPAAARSLRRRLSPFRVRR